MGKPPGDRMVGQPVAVLAILRSYVHDLPYFGVRWQLRLLTRKEGAM